MTDLNLPIEKLKNVGSRNLPRLKRLGIKNLKDLLWHLPARYEDYSQIIPIADIQPGQKVSIQGEIMKISSKRIFPRRMTITNAIVKDETSAIKVVWFNQPFIENTLGEGVYVSLAGKANLDKHGLYLSSPTYEKIANSESAITNGLTHTGRLVPVYPETEGVSSKYLRFLIKPNLKNLEIPEYLPQEVIQKYSFPYLGEAIKSIHFPSDLKEAESAKERLAFDDLLLFQIKALLERRRQNQLKSVSIKFDKELIQNFISQLPFELTTDQKIAAWEILKDLEKSYPMNRLMEGDVGSGKTVVALIGAVQVANGCLPAGGQRYQTCFMAPTEVLAHQHYQTISSLISNFPRSRLGSAEGEQFPIFKENRINNSIRIALLTGSESQLNGNAIKKPDLKKKISKGEVDLIIGTHAVIQKDVQFKNLAFVVIDEQHRFGIAQRAKLVKNYDLIPHLLSMTATPIPRTLALTIYGDLDISIIKEKPKNRQRIITKIISPSQRKAAYQFLRDEAKKDRQVFVICPRIELPDPKTEVKTLNLQSKMNPERSREGSSRTKQDVEHVRGFVRDSQRASASYGMNVLWAEAKAVEEEYKKLSKEIFPDLRIAMLHGKMKPKEKNKIMAKFKNRDFDILVSTSVIEVGVDIPNATIMMIENAERFGLAQLHQFRGRVGRGEHQSYCLLFSSTSNKYVNERLKALIATDDGFLLAEKDMAIRGPGEFFGAKQSGLPDLAMASLANIDLIKKARIEARLLLKENPNLNKYPLLKERLESFQKLTHFE